MDLNVYSPRLLLVLVLHISGLAGAQPSKKVDSLKQVIEGLSKEDTLRARLLNDLVSELRFAANVGTLNYIEEAISVAKKNNIMKELARAYYFAGDYFRFTASNDSLAEKYLQMCSKYALAAKDKNLYATALLQLSYLNLDRYKYQTALELGYLCSEVLEGRENYPNSGAASELLGTIYEEREDHEKADWYYKVALEKYKKNNRKALLAQINTSIAFNNLNWGRSKDALRYAREATKVAKNISINFATLSRNCIALAFANLNQLDSSLYYLKVNQDEINPAVNPTDLYSASLNHTAGVIYLKTKDYALAERYFLKALQGTSEFDALHLNKDIFMSLAEVYLATNRPLKASLYFKKHIKFNDSISRVRNKFSIADFETRYLAEKKEKENEMLKADLMLEQANTKTRKWQLILALSVIVLGAAGLLIQYRSRLVIKRKNLLLAEQNQEIQVQNEEILSQTEQLKQKNDFLEIQNQKLEEINQEKDGLMGVVAHDLRAPLNRAKGLAGLLWTKEIGPAELSIADKIRQVSDDGLNLIENILEVNSLSHDSRALMPDRITLDKFIENDVLTPIREYARKKSIELISVIDEKIELEVDAVSLKRILENLISNAVKFSPPSSRVLIHVFLEDEFVAFSVEDEGPGISMEDRKKMFRKFQRLTARPTGGETSTGLGLAIVKALVEKLNGEINVESDPGAGTEFIVKLPMKMSVPKKIKAA